MGTKAGRDSNIGIGLPGGQDTDPGLCPLLTSLQGPRDSSIPSFCERKIGSPEWVEERAESGKERPPVTGHKRAFPEMAQLKKLEVSQ